MAKRSRLGTYLVVKRFVAEIEIEVRATSPDDAVDRVAAGKGREVSEPEEVGDLPIQCWAVEDAGNDPDEGE